MRVWLLTHIEEFETTVVAVFTTERAAQDYLTHMPLHQRLKKCWDIEEWPLDAAPQYEPAPPPPKPGEPSINSALTEITLAVMGKREQCFSKTVFARGSWLGEKQPAPSRPGEEVSADELKRAPVGHGAIPGPLPHPEGRGIE